MANDIETKLKVTVDRKDKAKQHADISQQSKKYKNDMKDAELSANNISKAIKTAFNNSGVVSFFGAVKNLTEMMINASSKQSEYIENLNLLDVAFGKTSGEAEKFIDTLSETIGLDQSQMTRQLGVYRQMANAMGYTSEVSDKLSKNLSKLQLDMSSLYNLSFERAGNALESAITGQVKTIRALTGADITQATLQQEAYAMGIEKTVSTMSRAEKTILIYLSLERQMAEANGDLSRTINTEVVKTRNCFLKKLVNVFQNGVKTIIILFKQEMAY